MAGEPALSSGDGSAHLLVFTFLSIVGHPDSQAGKSMYAPDGRGVHAIGEGVLYEASSVHRCLVGPMLKNLGSDPHRELCPQVRELGSYGSAERFDDENSERLMSDLWCPVEPQPIQLGNGRSRTSYSH